MAVRLPLQYVASVVYEKVRALNEALAQAATHGVSVELQTVDMSRLNDAARRVTVSAQCVAHLADDQAAPSAGL